MFRHYITTAHRNLVRNKVYSVVNLASLAIGMGVSLLICQYVYFEWSFDRFHDSHKNIFRVTLNDPSQTSSPYQYPYETGYALGPAAKEQIPGISQYARLHKYSAGTVVRNPENQKLFSEESLDIFFVDADFLYVFNFPLVDGDKSNALSDKYNLVITQSTAERYFGDANPIGKTLEFNGGISPGQYTVSAVLKDIPTNSHLQFEFLIPTENYMQYGWGGAAIKNDDGWSSPDFVTYLRLEESAHPAMVTQELDRLLANRSTRTLRAGLQPLSNIHLRSDLSVDQSLVTNTGNINDVMLFLAIAGFILCVAWVNYINLATARSIQKAKEVGIRKSIGALRRQLFGQYITEALIVNILGILIAITMAVIAMPVLGSIVAKDLTFNLYLQPMFWLVLPTILILGSLLSGFYPALVLSSQKPTAMLRSTPAKPGGFTLRKGLITFQFLASLILMSGTYLVYQQVTFMKGQELGMDIQQILVLKGPMVNVNQSELNSKLQTFRHNVVKHHTITTSAASSTVPSMGYSTGLGVRKLGSTKESEQLGRVVFAGPGLPETYNMKFLAGNAPDESLIDKEIALVINEEAVAAFDLGTPEQAVDQKLVYKQDTFRIVGVVENFNWQSLKEAHMPYIFEFYPDTRNYLSVRLNTSDLQETISHVQSTFNSLFPGNSFEYSFLDETFNRQYKSDLQFGDVMLSFTMLAVVIACVGLFAMAAYSASIRTKEIGIRKVHGATIGSLMMLLSKEYLVLMIVANVLAIPALAYWRDIWLSQYAFRTAISLDLYFLPGLSMAAIALLTVSYHTYRTARLNPVVSLKAE
jgi:putative ABC transport system permease protein